MVAAAVQIPATVYLVVNSFRTRVGALFAAHTSQSAHSTGRWHGVLELLFDSVVGLEPLNRLHE